MIGQHLPALGEIPLQKIILWLRYIKTQPHLAIRAYHNLCLSGAAIIETSVVYIGLRGLFLLIPRILRVRVLFLPYRAHLLVFNLYVFIYMFQYLIDLFCRKAELQDILSSVPARGHCRAPPDMRAKTLHCHMPYIYHIVFIYGHTCGLDIYIHFSVAQELGRLQHPLLRAGDSDKPIEDLLIGRMERDVYLVKAEFRKGVRLLRCY